MRIGRLVPPPGYLYVQVRVCGELNVHVCLFGLFVCLLICVYIFVYLFVCLFIYLFVGLLAGCFSGLHQHYKKVL